MRECGRPSAVRSMASTISIVVPAGTMLMVTVKRFRIGTALR